MKILQLSLAAFVLAAMGTTVLAEEKADNKKLLLGKWEAVKVEEGTLPKGAIVEFLKDGKMQTTTKKDGKDQTRKGTYTVDGDTFTINFKVEDMEIKLKIKIKKLNDTELNTELDTENEGKTVTFKRVK